MDGSEWGVDKLETHGAMMGLKGRTYQKRESISLEKKPDLWKDSDVVVMNYESDKYAVYSEPSTSQKAINKIIKSKKTVLTKNVAPSKLQDMNKNLTFTGFSK